MKKNDPKRRGLAPRSLVSDDARRSALEALDRPSSIPAAAFVRAALEAAEPASEESVTPVVVKATAIAEPAPEEPIASTVPAPTPERRLVRVALSDVNLENRRFQYRVARSLARLQESIILQGQQVPVILRGAQAPYEIVSGFGRCDAISAAHAQGKLADAFVWADVRADLSDREAHEISVLENEDREDLSELDRVSKAKKLKDEGYQIGEIASVLKKGERMVQYYLSLAEAPRKIGDALAAGRLRPTHALVLTKFAREALGELTPEEIDARLDDLLARCERGISVAELRAALGTARAPQAPRIFFARGSGFELRGFHYEREMPEDARRALLAALDEARARIAADL